MKTIDTLVSDIEDVVDGKGGWDEAVNDYFKEAIGSTMFDRLNPEERKGGSLRMSSIGQPCARRLWYGVHSAGEGETLEPSTKFKFMFGDMLEDFLLSLAVAAGHTVTGHQDTLEIKGIKGHRDAVIDGVTVDVKSASSFSFQKFKKGLTDETDAFGYLTQLPSYVYAAKDDPLVTDKDGGAFLVIDKQHGHLCLDYHDFRMNGKLDEIEKLYQSRIDMAKKDTPPVRGFDPQPEGKSGNMKLGTNCSYCEFKHKCHPGLRTFLYKRGAGFAPTYLTEVVKVPKVIEVT